MAKRSKVIYLAGGMRTNWRDKVRIELGNRAAYFDPMTHGCVEPACYTAWDLAAIRGCDIVIVYFEITNPSGLGLALEVGYAKALGKKIIVVDEKKDRYFSMARECADKIYESLDAFLSDYHYHLELL